MNTILTTKELADLMGVSTTAINKRIKAGSIKATMDASGNYKINIAELSPKDQKKIELKQKRAVRAVESPDTSLENSLWQAADALRGTVDSSQYKEIVLGLIFLKYISDTFTKTENKMKQGESYKQIRDAEKKKQYLKDKDIYHQDGLFYIPRRAHWDFLKEKASSSYIAQVIDEAMNMIAKENESLTGVLPNEYIRSGIQHETLSELINIFSKLDFSGSIQDEQDLLGKVYEYFIGQFAESEGKRGGEFYTPKSIVELLVEVLEPFEGAKIFDPACGSGGMFVQSSKFLSMHDKDNAKLVFYGQELNQKTYKLAKMNLAMRRAEAEIELENSYYNDEFSKRKFDIVIANPPFNAQWEPKRIQGDDPRIQYGVAPASNANFMWIQHFIHHTKKEGRAGFVMSNGALSAGGKEGEMREGIVEDDLVEVIIACPNKLFYNVTIPVSLWFVSKRAEKRKKEILFIDASNEYEPDPKNPRRHNRFTSEHIQKIADTVNAWRHNSKEYSDIPGFCKSATLDEIAQNNFVLTPGRYVGVATQQDDGVPFKEKMTQLTTELNEQMKQEQKMSKNIQEQLEKIRV